MPGHLAEIVESASFSDEQVSARTAQIHSAILSKSKHVDGPDFTAIHSDDLKTLFDEYDGTFFGGSIGGALDASPLRFGFSKRMTSAGGKTVRYLDSCGAGSFRYELLVSATMLFGCCTGKDHRAVTACGIHCKDRLEALQRIMEHELVHLIEMLLWQRSSCAQRRFQSIAHRFFRHTEHKHNLITPRETALVTHGIHPGSRVRFQFEGMVHTGVVNRVNRRATVLVEDAHGQSYADGKRYVKYYVPAQLLELAE